MWRHTRRSSVRIGLMSGLVGEWLLLSSIPIFAISRSTMTILLQNRTLELWRSTKTIETVDLTEVLFRRWRWWLEAVN